MKVKGFTLHYLNSQKITAQAMEDLIDGKIDEIATTDFKIVRDNNTKDLITKDGTKTFAFNFDKRIITRDYDTLPYGYIR